MKEEVGMSQYEKKLRIFRVDGSLFLNMDKEDWKDVGVKKSIELKKIYIKLMDSYDIPRRCLPIFLKTEQDMSSTAPEEAIDNQKLSQCQDETDPNNSNRHSNEIQMKNTSLVDTNHSEDDDEGLMLIKHVIYEGDSDQMPGDGSVVKIHYSISLSQGGDIIESSRDRNGGKAFEFVLGNQQVIEGFELALKKMYRGMFIHSK